MRLLVIAALILPMAAGAQQGPPPDGTPGERHGGMPGGGPGGAPGLHGGRMQPTFISPVGKPYRSAPGEPYAINAWFSAIDTNHDGYVTAAEFVKEAEGFFTELDIDKDGEITPDELTRYEEQIAPEVQSQVGGMGSGMGRGPGRGGRGSGGRGGGHRGGGGGGGGGPEGRLGGEEGGSSGGSPARRIEMPKGAARFGLLGLPEPVIAADSNFNRGVSLDELRAAARARFGQLDPKGAGRLRLDDFAQTPVEKALGLKR